MPTVELPLDVDLGSTHQPHPYLVVDVFTDTPLEGNQLVISGRQENDTSRFYLYRGIATRHFQRGFLLADGLTVQTASLNEGLLAIDLWRPAPSRHTSKIEIRERG